MPLRLVEMVVPEDNLEKVEELLRDEPILSIWYDRISEQQVMLKILAQAEETETLMDLLDKQFNREPWFRVILLPVAASIPRVTEPAAEENAAPENDEAEKKKKERISREELYDAVLAMARLNKVYLGMVALSTVVAAVGLLNDNLAVIIGAMVIAPLLGPIIAQAMGTTLADFPLTRLAVKTNLAGLGLSLLLSMLMGLVFEVHPEGPELAARTGISLGDIAVALASGGAGALAFTAGAPMVLVGVMVAVALLPPLASLGLLIGSGFFIPALGAGLLLLTNIICINLAGVVVFWSQGIRPTKWWEEKKARQATKLSITVCAGLLVVMALAVMLEKWVKDIIFLYLL